MRTRLYWFWILGLAFGFIEAAVVVYLRALYYPHGFQFPVIPADPLVAVTELLRETATLILLTSVAILTLPKGISRLAGFMLLFGIWDIFYYVFLKLLLNWPEQLQTWDILFLLPSPWVGPVWAPLLVSGGLVYAGTTILVLEQRQTPLRLNRTDLVLEVFLGLVIIISFLIPGRVVLQQAVPEHFPWILFWAGYGPGLVLFIYRHRQAVQQNSVPVA